MVRNPVTSHAAISSAGEFTSRAISAETIKMPEPIIEPITSVVALVRPSPFTNSFSPLARETVFASVLKPPLLIGFERARLQPCRSVAFLLICQPERTSVREGCACQHCFDRQVAPHGGNRLFRHSAHGLDWPFS